MVFPAVLRRFNTREGVIGVFGMEYPMVCLRSLLFWTADFLLERVEPPFEDLGVIVVDWA